MQDKCVSPKVGLAYCPAETGSKPRQTTYFPEKIVLQVPGDGDGWSFQHKVKKKGKSHREKKLVICTLNTKRIMHKRTLEKTEVRRNTQNY